MNPNSTQMGGVYPLRRTMQIDSSRTDKDPLANVNLLSDLVSDDVFQTLQEQGLLNDKAIRDYHIRKSFKEFRKDMSTSEAIEKLQQLYPYLQFDTLRKIVYQLAAKKK
jgi:hypothetical protein